MKTESLVVGASVIGGVAAREIARRGIDTVVLSDKPHVGKNGKCTSIISASGLPRTGINFDEAKLHDIYGANIRCQNASLTVRRKEPVAYVLDRFKLDQLSVEQAQDAGAELKMSARFENWNATMQTAKTAAGDIQADYLIGADGVASTVAHQAGFPSLEHLVVAWEGEFENATLKEPDLVEVFLDVSGLFGWTVPAGQSTVRVGLATKTAAGLHSHKELLMKNATVQTMLKGSRKVREFYHAIPLYYRRQTQKNNVLLVGDAAGQVKATTGGGIVFGSLCAHELSEAVKQNLEGGVLDYEDRWRKKYAETLDNHHRIRKILNSLPQSLTAFCINAFSLLGGSGVLEKQGDMDFIVSRKDNTTK